MSGATLDTGALIALEAGSRRMAVPLDQRLALRVGARCAATGISDVVDVSVALCARDRGHPVITSDPEDIRTAEPSLKVLAPS